MRLFAFEGIRYTPAAGDVAELAALPYDQINDSLRIRYHVKSPQQFVHLTRPVAAPGGNEYENAAALHRQWLEEGFIHRDERPALYPYVIELKEGGQRLGVCALVGLEDASVIRPHEKTLDKPLADRLHLLETMRVDLEPAFFLSEDGGRLDELVREDAHGAPLVRHEDPDGHFHLLYKVEDPARIALYKEAVAGPAAIADGHHRYKVAQRFAESHHPAAGTAATTKLAVVTSIQAPGLTIDPIHRALREPIDLAKMAGVPAATEPFRGNSGQEFAAAVAAATQPALGVWVAGREPEIWMLDPTKVPDATNPGQPQLVVELFQKTVLSALGLTPEAETDGTVVYRSSPDELYQQVEKGELGTGFFLPPMAPTEFAAAIADGSLLPPKSTRFLPKVMSGLVWADHDSKLL